MLSNFSHGWIYECFNAIIGHIKNSWHRYGSLCVTLRAVWSKDMELSSWHRHCSSSHLWLFRWSAWNVYFQMPEEVCFFPREPKSAAYHVHLCHLTMMNMQKHKEGLNSLLKQTVLFTHPFPQFSYTPVSFTRWTACPLYCYKNYYPYVFSGDLLFFIRP